MRLTIGAAAPDFTATDSDGESRSLADLRGQRVWLGFHRYAGCPLCNLQVHRTIQRFDEWKERLAIMTVVQSQPATAKRLMGKQEPPFPILCDPEERLYRLYGCESSLAGYLAPSNAVGLAKAAAAGFLPGPMDGTKTRLPADFLIEPDGTLADVFYGSTIAEHIPFERVERFVGT